MKALRTKTRLDLHRENFRLQKGVGPLLRVEELDSEELTLLNDDFRVACQEEGADDLTKIYSTYVKILHSWGLMCPHPQRHRLYDGLYRADTPIMFDESRWYECQLCLAAVINR